MDASSSQPELEERIKLVDASNPSPDERARVVWELLQKAAPNLTSWDLVCFAANYLGWQAEGLAWLALPAKHICRLVYTAHYIDEETTIDSGLKDGKQRRVDSHPKPSTTVQDSSGIKPRGRPGFDVSGGGFT